ncbi:hypothetical protein SporoP8_10385 [Sporosarcina ureae]|nr:hypothetical protein SporoP8_10385 [Sporosarcina ureae]
MLPNLETHLVEQLLGCWSLSLLVGTSLDWLLGTKISEGMLSGPAQARGGLPPALSQLAIVPASCLRATAYPAVVPALLWESEFVCVSSKKTATL